MNDLSKSLIIIKNNLGRTVKATLKAVLLAAVFALLQPAYPATGQGPGDATRQLFIAGRL